MKAFAENARLGLVAAVVAAVCLFAPIVALAEDPVPADNQPSNTAPAANEPSNTAPTDNPNATEPSNTAPAEPAETLPTDGQKMVSPSASPEQQQKDKQVLQDSGGPGPIDLGDGNFINPMQLPDSSFIYDITISDLAKADSYLNGQTVQVVGEVVGDSINAEMDPDYCWIVLADSSGNTVSVYMPASQKSLIDTYGRYGQTGTQLQIRGLFSLSCDQHQGQTDIHSAHINVVRKGSVHRDELIFENFIPGAIAVGVGLVMLFIYWRMRERLR